MVKETYLYDLLGVSPTATTGEILKAFREKNREFSFDLDPGNQEKYQQIIQARRCLTNRNLRAAYDSFGEEILGNEFVRSIANASSQNPSSYLPPPVTPSAAVEQNDHHIRHSTADPTTSSQVILASEPHVLPNTTKSMGPQVASTSVLNIAPRNYGKRKTRAITQIKLTETLTKQKKRRNKNAIRNREEKVEAIELIMDISELYRGEGIKHEFTKTILCGACIGRGIKISKITKCKICKGSGKMTTLVMKGSIPTKVSKTCTACGGFGEKYEGKGQCLRCRGDKVQEVKEDLIVPIRGKKIGDYVILKGKGDQYEHEIPARDIVFILKETTNNVDHNIQLWMNNLVVEIIMSLKDVLFKKTFWIQQFDAVVLVKLNNVTSWQLTEYKRLPGLGMAYANEPPGDLIIQLSIQLPELNPEFLEILRANFITSDFGNIKKLEFPSPLQESDLIQKPENVELDLVEAFNGGRFVRDVILMEICNTCQGVGELPGCFHCSAIGFIMDQTTRLNILCPKCTGRTVVTGQTCSQCHGQKYVITKKPIEFNVLKGVHSGQLFDKLGKPIEQVHNGTVTIYRQAINTLGSTHTSQGMTTNPVARLIIKKHHLFSRLQDDLIVIFQLDPLKAMFGGIVSLHHLDGKRIHIKLISGRLNSMASLKKIKGLGMPVCGPDSLKRGKLYLKMMIKFPTQLKNGQIGNLRNIITTTKTRDTLVPVNLTLNDMFSGYLKKFNLLMTRICDQCSPKDDGSNACTGCRGSGLIFPDLGYNFICTWCQGYGVISQDCDKCKGHKVITEDFKVKIIIPRGYTCQDLTSKGNGNHFPGTLPANIVFQFFLERHSTYTMIGDDLYIELEVDYATLLLEKLVYFRHLDGNIRSFKLCNGLLYNGYKIIQHAGMPVFGTNGNCGDLYIKIKVVPCEQRKINELLLRQNRQTQASGLKSWVQWSFCADEKISYISLQQYLQSQVNILLNNLTKGDISLDLPITLEKYYSGTISSFKTHRYVFCWKCNATGMLYRCEFCDGYESFIDQECCKHCNKRLIKVECYRCLQKKYTETEWKEEVSIPKGFEGIIVLFGQGHKYSAESGGNIYIKVRVLQHDCFTLLNNDLFITLSIPFLTYLHKRNVHFKHIDGKPLVLKMDYNVINTPYSYKHIPKKGISKYGAKEVGDLFIGCAVEWPIERVCVKMILTRKLGFGEYNEKWVVGKHIVIRQEDYTKEQFKFIFKDKSPNDKDILVDVMKSMDSLFEITTQQVFLERVKICSSCNGLKMMECVDCNIQDTADSNQIDCKKCKQPLRLKNCPVCRNTSIRNKGMRFELTVPKGLQGGLLILGKGNQLPNSPPGDVYINLRLKLHSDFTIIDKDIYYEFPINFIFTLTGGIFRIGYLNSQFLTIRIRPFELLINPNKVLLGKGIPSYGNDSRDGNLYIKFLFAIPSYFKKDLFYTKTNPMVVRQRRFILPLRPKAGCEK